VCAKRRALSLDQWLGLGRELQACSQAQIVLSSLTLIEAASELSSLRRLCDNGELLVEANDMGAVQMLIERKLPFVGGPALNLYNGHALVQLLDAGMQRWVPPVECSQGLIADVLAQVRELGGRCPRWKSSPTAICPWRIRRAVSPPAPRTGPRTIASSAASITPTAWH
jgi:collagenase-like PrtC family protease